MPVVFESTLTKPPVWGMLSQPRVYDQMGYTGVDHRHKQFPPEIPKGSDHGRPKTDGSKKRDPLFYIVPENLNPKSEEGQGCPKRTVATG